MNQKVVENVMRGCKHRCTCSLGALLERSAQASGYGFLADRGYEFADGEVVSSVDVLVRVFSG